MKRVVPSGTYKPRVIVQNLMVPQDTRSEAERACSRFRLLAHYVTSWGLDDGIGMIMSDGGGALPQPHDCEVCAQSPDLDMPADRIRSLQRILHGLRLTTE